MAPGAGGKEKWKKARARNGLRSEGKGPTPKPTALIEGLKALGAQQKRLEPKRVAVLWVLWVPVVPRVSAGVCSAVRVCVAVSFFVHTGCSPLYLLPQALVSLARKRG